MNSSRCSALLVAPRTWFLLALLVVFPAISGSAVLAEEENVLTPIELINAYSTTQSQIQTIQLTYCREVLTPSPEKFREANWWKDETRERLREKWDALIGGSDFRRFLNDTLIDRRSKRVKVLHCSRDRRLASQIDIHDQKDTSGRVVPLTLETSRLIVNETFLLRFILVGSDRERSLSELSDFCGGAVLIGRSAVGGAPCYHLQMQHPGVEGEFEGSTMDFFLDAQHGFLVRKLVKHIKGDNGDLELHVEVKKFFSGGDGVFFPSVVDRYMLSAGDLHQHSVARVTQIKINRPLDKIAFAFVFPKNLFVQEYQRPPGPSPVSNVPVQLIGDNGEVVRKLEGDEFRLFIEEQYRLRQPRRVKRGFAEFLLASAAIALAAGGVFVIALFAKKFRPASDPDAGQLPDSE
jgi:hypothetical protein